MGQEQAENADTRHKRRSGINQMTATFVALCKEADFSNPVATAGEKDQDQIEPPVSMPLSSQQVSDHAKAHRFALAYNIHIELPPVRDQAVYDAIFKS